MKFPSMPLYRTDYDSLLKSFSLLKKDPTDSDLLFKELLNSSSLFGSLGSGGSELNSDDIADCGVLVGGRHKEQLVLEPSASFPIDIPLADNSRFFNESVDSCLNNMVGDFSADSSGNATRARGNNIYNNNDINNNNNNSNHRDQEAVTPLMTPPVATGWASSQQGGSAVVELAEEDLWSVPLLVDDDGNEVRSFNGFEDHFLGSVAVRASTDATHVGSGPMSDPDPASVPVSMPVPVPVPESDFTSIPAPVSVPMSVSSSAHIHDFASVPGFPSSSASSCPSSATMNCLSSATSSGTTQELITEESVAGPSQPIYTNEFLQNLRESLDRPTMSNPEVSRVSVAGLPTSLSGPFKDISTTLFEIGGPEHLYSLLFNKLDSSLPLDLKRIAAKYSRPSCNSDSSLLSSSTKASATSNTNNNFIFKRSYYDTQDMSRAGSPSSSGYNDIDTGPSIDFKGKRVKLEDNENEEALSPSSSSQASTRGPKSKEEKMRLKRIRNTEAARRSRARKMERVTELEQTCYDLTKRNEELELQVFNLMVMLAISKGKQQNDEMPQ